MRLTRVAFKLVAATLAILGVEALGTSIATADTTIPNQYDLVPASATGLNTLIRDTGNPRTAQLLIHESQLTAAVGQNITGIAYRLFTGSTAAFPATDATWSDYTINLGPGVAFGSQGTTFASNFAAPPTVVRNGPLTIPAGSLPLGGPPRPFGSFIDFTTPYLYTGGNLLIEVRHPGSNIVNTGSDFLEVALTTDPGFNTQFWSATATGAAATVGAQSTFTVVRLRTEGVANLSIGDATVTEGDAGTVEAGFEVTLDVAAPTPVTVDFATADDTATAGADYTATSGTLTFAPGTTSQTVTVSVIGDTLDELDETYFVNLSSPNGAGITDGQGLGTIIDDDGPVISIGDATVTEGDVGTVDASFAVALSASSPGEVTVAFATADGSATAGSDYIAATGVVTFAPGTTTQAVTVSVIGDLVPEIDETYFVNLSAPTGGTLGDAQGLGTIIDDDGGVSFDNTGELNHGFKVTGDLASAGAVEDTDSYVISQKPYSSYEVVIDEASGDISPATVERLDASSTVLQTSAPVGSGTARSLRWANDTSNTIDDETVRVASGGCTTDCGADDTYRLRAYETTYAIPRFNNTGSQITIVLLQNPTDSPVDASLHFWSTAGALLHTEPVTVAPKSTTVINSSTIVPVNGVGGSVTVTHDGRFGELAGKTVALEPATGFSFDSPMQSRAR